MEDVIYVGKVHKKCKKIYNKLLMLMIKYVFIKLYNYIEIDIIKYK